MLGALFDCAPAVKNGGPVATEPVAEPVPDNTPVPVAVEFNVGNVVATAKVRSVCVGKELLIDNTTALVLEGASCSAWIVIVVVGSRG